jgi:molybdopterin converting factor small subunit
MATVTVRLFGFGPRASEYETETRLIAEGATIRELWEDMRKSAMPESLLARIEEKKVWVLINGRHFNQAEKWETPLAEGDTVTFMVYAMGG